MTKTKERIVKAPDLSRILKSYEDQWVALSEDEKRVLSSGKTLKETESKLDSKQLHEAIFFKVPPSNKLFIPSFS
ncbi:hypothetical protein IIA95_01870 [Patescibacteria group bacterium]|nr:hypothetical protein [Patescibacteria group bacterium]